LAALLFEKGLLKMKLKFNENVFKKIEIECPECRELFNLLDNNTECHVDIINDDNFDSIQTFYVDINCPYCNKWLVEAIFTEAKNEKNKNQ
jgi:phage FluMu protein Com